MSLLQLAELRTRQLAELAEFRTKQLNSKTDEVAKQLAENRTTIDAAAPPGMAHQHAAPTPVQAHSACGDVPYQQAHFGQISQPSLYHLAQLIHQGTWLPSCSVHKCPGIRRRARITLQELIVQQLSRTLHCSCMSTALSFPVHCGVVAFLKKKHVLCESQVNAA